MAKRRMNVEDREITVETLKVNADVLQKYAEDFHFGHLSTDSLRARLLHQARTLLDICATLDNPVTNEDGSSSQDDAA